MIKQKGISYSSLGKRLSQETNLKIGESLYYWLKVEVKPIIKRPKTRLNMCLRTGGVSVKLYD